MNLTANQCLNLLWIHYMETQDLGFTPKELQALEYEICSRFRDLDSPYKMHLKYNTQEKLTKFLLDNSGQNIFNSEV